MMRTQTGKSPASRTIHHAIEEVLPGADFSDGDDWNTHSGSRVPILWQDDSEGDEGLESELKFDHVLDAAFERSSSSD